MFNFLKKIFGTAQQRKLYNYWKIVAEVNSWEAKYQALSDDALRSKTQEFRERIQQGETTDKLLPEAYAAVKNVCRRLMGTPVHVFGYDQAWDMIPYDEQIVGAIAMHYGAISEMATGEGKTLTAVMPLYLNALTGESVHLVTVNDYLVNRDCQWVGSILRWLGLTTGALTNSSPMEERKALYANDVLYGTSSEFGFDYLRDNSIATRKEEQVQRGYYFAIVDEIDSILVDEARTPLIISGPVPESRQMYDELKTSVEQLIRIQRDLCNKMATEARQMLDKPGVSKDEMHEAFRRLWLVGKGMPRHKIVKRVKENPDWRVEIDNWDLYFHGDSNKEERAETLAELYIIVDERNNEYELTDKGIAAWGETSGKDDDFIMFDIGYEFLKIDSDPDLTSDEKIRQKRVIQEEDAKRKERTHNLRQMLRAQLLMERDIDYIVQDNKIVIVDENTGRPQPGRRFSDGLHQSIEAKEGVAIQQETQTFATITLQNYFRMYKKLAGMTGTAATEAGEFKQIYKLDVLEIPTHKLCIRVDNNDEIYMTEREKYNAILNEIKVVHEQGRPLLIGTESVETSEKLARILKQHKLEYTVLNAKHHEQEAEIVAKAGHRGAITIATNMAGRGTDIKLEPGVADLGGLFVLGTTRHQSRRVDRQLRGRCARQGDPGTGKFYLSFEDPLLRQFSSPTMTALIQRFRPEEGEAISAGLLNRSIETAQKRLEQRNYMSRKHTLEYDDVMNKQRQEIYTFRNDLLHTEDIMTLASDLLEQVCTLGSEKFFRSRSEEGGWDPEGYREWLLHLFPVSFEPGCFDQDLLEATDFAKMARDTVVKAFHDKMERENSKVQYKADGHTLSPSEQAARNIMIRKLDHLWQQHLLGMDHLRTDVNLRAAGQRDPLMEFKHEAFRLFDEMSRDLYTSIARDIFAFEVVPMSLQQVQERLFPKNIQLETSRSFINEIESAPVQEEVKEPEPIIAGPRTGRNDLCPCGSGKKYKKCHGVEETVDAK